MDRPTGVACMGIKSYNDGLLLVAERKLSETQETMKRSKVGLDEMVQKRPSNTVKTFGELKTNVKNAFSSKIKYDAVGSTVCVQAAQHGGGSAGRERPQADVRRQVIGRQSAAAGARERRGRQPVDRGHRQRPRRRSQRPRPILDDHRLPRFRSTTDRKATARPTGLL